MPQTSIKGKNILYANICVLIQTMDYFSVVIEGNISSGKTEFIKYLEKKYGEMFEIVHEPLHIWKAYGSNRVNMLEKLYSNLKQNAYAFQLMAQCTRLDICITPCKKKIRICERGLESVVDIFSKMLYSSGYLNDTQLQHLSSIEKYYHGLLKCEPNLIIYLKTHPKIAFTRMKHRARSEETSLSFEYINQLHLMYEQWLDKNKNVLVVDGDVTLFQLYEYIDSIVIPKIFTLALNYLCK